MLRKRIVKWISQTQDDSVQSKDECIANYVYTYCLSTVLLRHHKSILARIYECLAIQLHEKAELFMRNEKLELYGLCELQFNKID